LFHLFDDILVVRLQSFVYAIGYTGGLHADVGLQDVGHFDFDLREGFIDLRTEIGYGVGLGREAVPEQAKATGIFDVGTALGTKPKLHSQYLPQGFRYPRTLA